MIISCSKKFYLLKFCVEMFLIVITGSFLSATTVVKTMGVSANASGINQASFRSAPMSASLKQTEDSETLSKGSLEVVSTETNTQFNVMLLEDNTTQDDGIDIELSTDSQVYKSDENGKGQVEISGDVSTTTEVIPGDYQEGYILVIAY